jgi:hypothetical protein
MAGFYRLYRDTRNWRLERREVVTEGDSPPPGRRCAAAENRRVQSPSLCTSERKGTVHPRGGVVRLEVLWTWGEIFFLVRLLALEISYTPCLRLIACTLRLG